MRTGHYTLDDYIFWGRSYNSKVVMGPYRSILILEVSKILAGFRFNAGTS